MSNDEEDVPRIYSTRLTVWLVFQFSTLFAILFQTRVSPVFHQHESMYLILVSMDNLLPGDGKCMKKLDINACPFPRSDPITIVTKVTVAQNANSLKQISERIWCFIEISRFSQRTMVRGKKMWSAWCSRRINQVHIPLLFFFPDNNKIEGWRKEEWSEEQQ